MKTLATALKIEALIVILTLIFGVASIKAFGQQTDVTYKTYKGSVVDSETQKAIAFTNVTVKGTSVGTVTNSEGDFTLKIKNSLNVDAVEFSHLGYKNLIVNLSDLKTDKNVIKLQTSSISLAEIKIRPYTPYEMIDEMIKNVKSNYCNSPSMMTGFYREAIKKKSNYIYISEAIVDIYKASYIKDFDNDAVKIYKGRKSEKAKAADTIMVKLKGGPSVSLLLDIIKNPYILFEEDKEKNYEMKFDNMQSIDGKLIYVIEFKQRSPVTVPLYNGKLYINAENLALTAAEFSLNLENPVEAAKFFIQKKPMSLRFEPISTNYFVKYKEEKGKYYFSYARYELNFTCDWKKRLFKSKYEVMAEIAVTERAQENVQKIERKDRVGQYDVFADKVTAFTDNDFWGENNTIEPDHSIEDALIKYGKWLKKNNK